MSKPTLEERVAALETENREMHKTLASVTGLLRRMTYAEVIRAERWGQIAESHEMRHLQATDAAVVELAAVPSGTEEASSYCPRCHGDGIDPDCDGRDEFHHYACTACDGTGHAPATKTGTEEASDSE